MPEEGREEKREGGRAVYRKPSAETPSAFLATVSLSRGTGSSDWHVKDSAFAVG